MDLEPYGVMYNVSLGTRLDSLQTILYDQKTISGM